MKEEARVDSVQTAEETRSKDPVCGMMVDPAAARGGSHAHNGKTYFFCNPRCRERFAADPEKYLDPAYKPGGMGGMVQLGGTHPSRHNRSRLPGSAKIRPASEPAAGLTVCKHVFHRKIRGSRTGGPAGQTG